VAAKITKTKDPSPQFARDLDSYMQKSFDMGSNESVSNELWSSENKAFMDASTLKSLFFTEDWVYIICDLIANKISSQPLKVMRAVVSGESESVEPMPEHPLNALIEQPNEWQDYSQWMYNTVVELYLMGNAIIWNAPRSGQLLTMPSENVAMQFNEKGKLTTYSVYETSELLAMQDLGSKTDFNPSSIIHVRRPNPSSLLWGLSPFIPGKRSILFNRYSTDYLNAFYLKQATPGLALSLDRNVNEDVALRQLRSFESSYQGRKNQRRTLILPKGVSATTLTHTLSDQKLIEHINQNRETICALLKVPKHELSLQTAGSLGSEEYKTAIRNFWEACLIPGMRFIEGAMTKFFQVQLGEDAFFQFDLSSVDSLKDDLRNKAETAAVMLTAGLSINEVRQQVWQQEPSAAQGSNDPYVLVQKAGQVATLATGFSSLLQAPEGEVKVNAPNAKINITPQIENFRDHVVKQLIDEESRTLSELGRAATDLLVGMTATAIDVVDRENKATGFISMKALPTKRVLSRKIKQALTDKFEEEWQGQVAKTLKVSVDLGYDQQLQVIFNPKAKLEVEALRARDGEKRRLILEARGLDSFHNISDTHTERIMVAITEGQKKGQSVSTIMRSVAELLGTPKQLAGKAETIARTETLTAVSIGQAAALRNAKEVMPGLKKAWLTAGDNRVRDSHQALNGDVIDADAKFANGLDHPRDVDATEPGSVVNCRCNLLIIPPNEKLEIT